MALVGIIFFFKAAFLYKIGLVTTASPNPIPKGLHPTVTIPFKDKDPTILWWLWEHTMPQLPFIGMLKPLWVSGHQEFDI